MTIEVTLAGIQDALVSHAASLGVFETTTDSPPATVPTSGIHCVWEFGDLEPSRSSGLAATSAVLTWTATILASLTTQPGSSIDRDALDAADALIRSLIGDFELGGLVREVDVRGADGSRGLTARAGYATVNGSTRVRLIVVEVPLVVNDLYDEIS